MICHFCNKKGHKWRHCRFRLKDCPSWTPEKKSDDSGADWDGDWVDDPSYSNWF